ncbi:hypothetical protein VD0002_g9332 [Verticillium dahliae]|uniref:DnaJ homologue subfamily C member 28 conserved domain-containing protein n=1 Tax=Verticillium dahliae TaxID=27337 RepID=A0AA44WMT0_VERDA|nr:hypothetical protein EV126DRAFT_492382 [Verticillium dahliae]PNH33635.1 hypothetical protein BJF96_g3071 [Verticillium dahliae]PNH43747.1 hypothetical protein VD0003_g9570 [Verticillium dahliae]PNH58194.1 hypothetical protein VD0002_g9332 [Verticillium dahliae]
MPTNLPRPCSQCICRLRLRSLATRSPPLRLLSSASQHKPSKDPSATASEATASEANASEKPGNEAPAAAPQDDPPAVDTLPGALSRRLEQATEEAMTGSTSGFRAVATEAGFSPALKDRLFEKVQAATFQDAHAAAFAEAGLTAREGTVPAASAAASAATPWTGTETQHDAVLRMLDDAHRPLPVAARGTYRIPQPVALPRRRTPVKASVRAAHAREMAGAYIDLKTRSGGGGTSSDPTAAALEDEREAFREEMRRRFEPVARAVPATVSGLAALANRRIEEAMGAGGQFRGIARGAGVRGEAATRNPFVDTTQDLMDRMIQRQGIVPPWIEKQQEVVREVAAFRARLRGDWARHAARMIAASGGDVTAQAARADGFAAAEARVNPRRRKDEAAAAAQGAAPVEASAEHVGAIFRDPAWEAAERSYLTLSVETLNSLTRSYNLMAPELAKKPYYSLERELKACYADVAPLLPDMIRDRGLRPARSLLAEGQGAPRPPSMFAQLGGEGHARVYDNKAPRYGFKEMWRDIWGAKKA